MKEVRLKKGRRLSLERRHPWVFSRAIESLRGLEIGDVVNILDENNHFVARGYYEEGSIALRILTFDASVVIDEAFWSSRFNSALSLRKALGVVKPKEAYRLIHGEGDLLPGLIVDIYADVAVVQAHTVSMHLWRHEIKNALKSLYGNQLSAIYYKSSETVPTQDRILDEILMGEMSDFEDLVAQEEGISFFPDILRGQKTGYFLDQRLSRKRVGELSSARSVLNMFSYSGGFTLSALRGEAESVVSVDSSARAMDLLEQNLILNKLDKLDRHTSVTEDAFKYLQDMNYGTHDLIILDPPAFVKRREVLRNGLQGYRKLNTEALRKIAPSGLLFTFSCSQLVSPDEFQQAIFTSALHAEREVRILEQFGQFGDHPTSIFHPEGNYLKGLLLYVE